MTRGKIHRYTQMFRPNSLSTDRVFVFYKIFFLSADDNFGRNVTNVYVTPLLTAELPFHIPLWFCEAVCDSRQWRAETVGWGCSGHPYWRWTSNQKMVIEIQPQGHISGLNFVLPHSPRYTAQDTEDSPDTQPKILIPRYLDQDTQSKYTAQDTQPMIRSPGYSGLS